MEAVLLDGFKKIRKASSRKHKELRTACDAATEELQKAKYLGFSAERYWEVFELALNAGSNDVTEAALEALFRLIQDGHVRPTATVERGGKVVELSAVMLDIICEAKLGTDAARAWSAKALLACVTAPEVTTHGDALIRAVRVLRASALESKAAAPKATARGALQDIISSTFARMEAAEVKRRETAASSPTAAAAASSSTTASVSPAASPPGSPTTVSNMYPMSSAVAAVQPPPLPPAGPPPPLVAMYPEVFLFLCYDLQHAKRSSASSSRSSASAAAAAAASTAASLTAAAEASSPGGTTTNSAVAANSSSSGNSSSSAAVESRSSSSGSVRQGGHRFPAVQHRDAWLCLRELCTATEDMATTLLRLELILGLLEKSGPAFRGGEPFVECVRTSLCAELLKNCTSNVMPVVSLSLRIFVALTHNFKDHLKSEVEVFVTRIFLRILESENRSHEQKMLVMEVFYDLCTDPRALVEIFLNYDCDLYAIDLFKRIVASMAKVSKMAPPRNSAAAGEKGAREEDSLRALGLEGLVAIVSSLHTAARLDDATREAAAARAAPAEVAADVGPESEADREALQTLLLQQQGYHRHHNHPGHHTAAAAAVSPTSSAAAAAAAGGSKQPLSLSLSQHDSSSSGAGVSGSDAPPPPPVPPSPSPHSAFDLKKKLQQEVDTGIMKINIKPDVGLAYLASKGHLDAADPRAVAAFFHEHVTRLSKTVVGEYMGRGREDHGGFCVAVLHAYVDLMSFKGLAFDEAIRHYLSGFRLPGEAQKIDRIMEKFAERYCLDNPGVFPNPDTAFILAFSVIMLNTDLHNPAIREDRRMTKAGFIGNSRGISAGGSDLPDDLLGAIFDRIAASPISLKEDDERRNKGGKQGDKVLAPNLGEMLGGGAAAKRRAKDEAYLKEREDMLKAGEAALQSKSRRRGSEHYITTENGLSLAEHVQPMFEVAWGPAIGAFSQVLETAEDPKTVSLCLTGLRQGLRLSGSLDMHTARETFVNALAKFTLPDAARDVRPKNVACIKALLAVALTDGNILRDSWSAVLNCTSLLARLQLSASGLATDDAFFSADAATDGSATSVNPSRASVNAGEWEWVSDLKRTFDSSAAAAAAGGLSGGASGVPGGSNGASEGGAVTAGFTRLLQLKREPQHDEMTAEALTGEIDQLSIDRVYASSAKLDRDSLRCFVQQLVEVSRNEIAARPAPRVFSLQRLVEVADYNMDIRSRIDWASMWGDIAGHLAACGCMPGNSAVAMYAIDCLRQLALKFLTKEELRDFNFQRAFLGPFEDIMRRSAHAPTRELVARCLDNVIAARAANIRSGWKTLLTVLTLAARDREEAIVQLACGVVDRLVAQRFALVQYDFLDLVACLLAMTRAPHLDVALSCVGHLRTCARALAAGEVDVTRQRVSDHAADALGTLPQELLGPLQASELADQQQKRSGTTTASATVAGSSSSDEAAAAASASTTAASSNSGSSGGATVAATSILGVSPWGTRRARLQLWWPLLAGLSECLGDPHLDQRSAAVSTLRDVMRDYGGAREFDCAWPAVFTCIMFPTMRHAASDATVTPQLGSALPTQGNDFPLHMDSWIATTVPQIFQTVVEVYVKNAPVTRQCALCLPNLLEFLGYYVCQDIEVVARLAVQALHQLVEGLPDAAALPPEMWTLLCDGVAGLLRKNLPSHFGSLKLEPDEEHTDSSSSAQQNGISSSSTSSSSSYYDSNSSSTGVSPPGSPGSLAVNHKAAMTRLVVVLRLQHLAYNLIRVHADAMSAHHFTALLGALREGYRHARRFNASRRLRTQLFAAGFMHQAAPALARQLPHLLDQETEGRRYYMAAVFRLYGVSLNLDDFLPAVGGLEQDREAWMATPAGRHPKLVTDDVTLVPGRASVWITDSSWDQRAFAEPLVQAEIAPLLAEYYETDAAVQRSRADGSSSSDGVTGSSNSGTANRRHSSQEWAAAAQGGGGTAGLDHRGMDLLGTLETEVAYLTPVVLQVLRGITALSQAQFTLALPWLYPRLRDLVVVRSVHVRALVRELFGAPLIEHIPRLNSDTGSSSSSSATAATSAKQ